MGNSNSNHGSWKQKEIDVDRCIKMALIHDLAETETGDLVTRADSEAQQIDKDHKEELEQAVMENLNQKIKGDKILRIWEEYEKRKTPEAKFVKDMDMIDMCLTALKYEKQKRYDPEEDNDNFKEYDNLDEFFATTEPETNY